MVTRYILVLVQAHGHHHYHPYRRSERGYFMYEFKKAKPPTFNGELKKLDDVEAW